MSHPVAEPHLPLEEVLDGIFFLQGSIRMGPGMRINRNMVVVKDGEALTLLNPVRLVEDGDTPLRDSRFFVFQDTKKPECALLIERHGGVLVTCDSVQHHIDTTNCSFLGRVAMSLMGFKRPMNIGPPWRKTMTQAGGSLDADFRRLLELEFDHGAGGHGQFCLGGAKDKLADTVASVFG